MIFLFIGGNVDGEEIEVPADEVVFRVADKPVHLLPNDRLPPTCGYSIYTKRICRHWSIDGGFWTTDYYFAVDGMSDQEAFNRYIELNR